MKLNNNTPNKKSSSKKMNRDTSKNSLSPTDIAQSSEYKSLLEEFQNGHWENCQQLIDVLNEKYPNNAKVDEFKHELEFKNAAIQNLEYLAKDEKKYKIRQFIILLSITIGFLCVAIASIWFGVKQSQRNSQLMKLQETQNQITTLSNQIEALLISGQMDKASELIQKMKGIDAANPMVVKLSQKTDAAIKLNLLYQDALAKLQKGLNSEALAVLTEIQKEDSNYKDVPRLIDEANKEITKTQALNNGKKAYEQGLWQEAINNFEQAQTLGSSISDLSFKEMLVKSYLQWITGLLESDDIAPANIDQAQIYYRRAISLIPQSQNYISEREKFQKIATNLIGLKYTQIARTAILDPEQTPGSVSRAVVYLKEAVNLNPASATLQTDLNKIILYQSGFQAYSEMKWLPAIEQLSSLIAIDEDYANGFAKQLLYEAYINQGIKYESSGFYPNARGEFEAAESLIWNDGNLINLYLAEVDLGRILGEMKDYKNAASYFKFAIEKIDYTKRAIASPVFVNDLQSAITLFSKRKFEDSYNLFMKTLPGDYSLLYTENEIDVPEGEYLAIIAVQNKSSVQAILERNNLPSQTITALNQKLYIPSISE